MLVKKEQLDELNEILLKEYKIKLSDLELSSEALRLSEFAKTVLKFNLSKVEKIINE